MMTGGGAQEAETIEERQVVMEDGLMRILQQETHGRNGRLPGLRFIDRTGMKQLFQIFGERPHKERAVYQNSLILKSSDAQGYTPSLSKDGFVKIWRS